MNFLESHKLFLTPLSPIHIGTGDDYEPTNYIISNGQMNVFDPTLLGLTENERTELLKICDIEGEDGILRIQKYFYSKADQIKNKVLFKVPVANGVIEKYNKRIGQVAQREPGKRVVNKLMVEKTYFNFNQQIPVIPGSSIKGAIRTAILDVLNNGEKWNKGKESKELEQMLLGGDFTSDPFRLVKVSDSISPAVNRRIMLQVNRKKKADLEGQRLETCLEVIEPMQPLAFTCELNFQNNPRQFENKKEKRETPEFEITLKEIIDSCNRHYLKQIDHEHGYNQDRKWFNTMWLEGMRKIQEKIKNKDNVFLLRVGKHSNAESITLEGVRKIKITGKNGAQSTCRSETNCYWFASEVVKAKDNLLPFGWLLVEIDKADDEIAAIVKSCSEKMKEVVSRAFANNKVPDIVTGKSTQKPPQRFQTYQKKPTFIQKKSKTGITAGAAVTGILLEEKTKKDGWKVQCKEDETLSGVITNSAAVPNDKKAGDEVLVKITSVKENQSLFMVNK